MKLEKKIVFVTGGVLSSLGKGIVASSIGALFEARGIKTNLVKADPYLNIDSGTMSPYQHGEVFVTHDGAETDLDLGYYERFTNKKMTKDNHITSGKILNSVISRERKGDYLGATVQVIPHVTDEIKRQIIENKDDSSVIIVEIGGTVGDIESQPFLEAVRQLRFEYKSTVCVHVTLVPFIGPSGEIKTKPTQHSVKELRSLGISPDIIVCRTTAPIPDEQKRKIGLFANLDSENIFENPDLKSIYEVPLVLESQNIMSKILPRLGYDVDLAPQHLVWADIVQRLFNPEGDVDLAMVGKYSELTDAYKSINEALLHAGLSSRTKVNIHYVPAEDLEKQADRANEILDRFDGILIPGGFGERGIEGKMIAARYCRVQGKPYFGICLGMQLAVIDFARDVLNIKKATSAEFDPSSDHPVFCLMKDWIDQHGQKQDRNQSDDIGGTMRLGGQSCKVIPNTKAYAIYKSDTIIERHRHRFELNPHYIEKLESKGLKISGYSVHRSLAEMIELENHPWFIGCQFHPEFLSRPMDPHPLFVSFVQAMIDFKEHQHGSVNTTT